MREKLRRRICRSAFLTLCLAPTLLTSGLIAYRTTPLYTRAERVAWQSRLHRELGLQAAIERVGYPRGGVVLLNGVTLTDPDTQRRVLRARLVELGETERGLIVVLSQPEVDAGQFFRVWELFHERILRGAPPARAIQVQAAEATLHGHPQSQTFTEVSCQITPLEHGVKTAVDFRVAGVGMPSPAQIQITRNRQSDPPATSWEVRTGPSPLPCTLFAGYCPSLAQLGPECCFQGTLWAEQTAAGWNGELAGRFQHVDLERWLEPFPHKLTGTAELVFSEATFRNNRLRTASGSLHCPGGVLSNSLLTAFAQAFHLEVAPREAAEDEPLREYQQLACGFQFDAHGHARFGPVPGRAAGSDPGGPPRTAGPGQSRGNGSRRRSGPSPLSRQCSCTFRPRRKRIGCCKPCPCRPLKRRRKSRPSAIPTRRFVSASSRVRDARRVTPSRV